MNDVTGFNLKRRRELARRAELARLEEEHKLTAHKIDYDAHTKAELIEIADQAGIDVNNRMTKAEIIERLEGGE